jgi:hypothetical protein
VFSSSGPDILLGQLNSEAKCTMITWNVGDFSSSDIVSQAKRYISSINSRSFMETEGCLPNPESSESCFNGW